MYIYLYLFILNTRRNLILFHHHVTILKPTFILEWISNFFHIFSIINMCTWIKPFIFNMLKLLFTNCILHSLEYIKTHAIQCFVIIFEWLMSFFTFLKLSSLHELNHPIWIYWNNYSNVTYCFYYYILKHI